MSSRPPVAIVGVSALFPQSETGASFWRNILVGSDLFEEIPESHWRLDDYYDPDPETADRTYVRRGAFLPDIDFSPIDFGVPPNNLSATDTEQLLALVVAQRLLEDAVGSDFGEVERERTGCVLGVAGTSELALHMAGRMQRPIWEKVLRGSGLDDEKVETISERIAEMYVPWEENVFPGLLNNVVAGRVANRFDLGAGNSTVDAACGSSLAALEAAVHQLYLDEADMMITGGVDALNEIIMHMCFGEVGALSPSGDCRPFSSEADGTLLAEGVGMFALKRLEDAEADGDDVYAVIRGVGSSSDGRGKAIYAPCADGQARAIERAYELADYSPRTVELLEAHGTATTAGDAAEVEGLKTVFEEAEEVPESDRAACAVGSVKSQMGHAKAAAGAAGLFKAVQALNHGVLPPTTKVDEPNPALDLDGTMFDINTERRPWIRGSSHPRRASVSAFGFGGTNYHLTLEEYTGPAPSPNKVRSMDAELVVLSGDDAGDLIAQCREWTDELETDGMTTYLARRSQETFEVDQPARLAVVAEGESDLREKLERAADRIAEAPEESFSSPGGTHYGWEESTGEVAFLFPGQGSQYLSMGAEMAMHFETVRAVWDRAADLDFGEVPLHDVVFPPPAFDNEQREAYRERLTATEWAQPAIGAASASMLRLLDDLGLEPSCVAGHSYGEVTALHAAGALDESEMLRLSRKRGELMANASETAGAMMAVTGDVDAVLSNLGEWESAVTVANYNSPKQVVLSGSVEAIDELDDRLDDEKVSWSRLSVATAFHSPLVSDATDPFRDDLADLAIEAPEIPVYGNAEAAPYPEEPEEMREKLAGQIAEPVRFVDQIREMYEQGARTFVEVGPGNVLTGLADRCLDGSPHRTIALDTGEGSGIASLWEAIGQLAVAGVDLAFDAVWEGYGEVTDPRTDEQGVAISIDGKNVGTPYPGEHLEDRFDDLFAESGDRSNVERAVADESAAAETAEPTTAERSGGQDGASTDGPHQVPEIDVPSMTIAGREPCTCGEDEIGDPCQCQFEDEPVEGERTIEESSTGEGTPDEAWLEAFREQQHQTIEAHRAYQERMAETHRAFLETMGANLEELERKAPSAADGEGSRDRRSEPQERRRRRARRREEPSVDSGRQRDKQRDATAGPESTDGDAPRETEEPAPATPEVDIEEVLFEVVADEMGYQEETLDLEMDLVSDLGVDSIKQAEIFSELEERLPEAPEVDLDEVADLGSLGEIVEYMEDHVDGAAEGGNDTGGGGSEGDDAVTGGDPESRRSDHQVSNDLRRAAVRAVEKPAASDVASPLDDVEQIYVTRTGTALDPALAGRFETEGLTVDMVDEIPEGAEAAVVPAGLGRIDGVEDAVAVNRRAFRAVRSMAGGPEGADGPTLLVTVQDTGGDFGLSGEADTRAWTAGIGGLAKTAALEWPEATVKCIDLECSRRQPHEQADAIVREITDGGPEVEVGLGAEGGRVTPVAVPGELESPVETAPLDEEAVVVVAGGAKGVTATSVCELAERKPMRFVLLGRTELVEEPEATRGLDDESEMRRALREAAEARGDDLPLPEQISRVDHIQSCREIRETIERLEAVGAEARYVSADVRDREALGEAFDEIRDEWGPVEGLIHGAGVVDDATLDRLNDEKFERVFDTKVEGLRALLRATAEDPLRMICLFSSLAARNGNPGQAAYAMANEVLNKVAAAEASERPDRCRVKSIEWGPWDGGMVTPALKERFEEQGIELIEPGDGARMMVQELFDAPSTDIEVVVAAQLPEDAIGEPDWEEPGGETRGTVSEGRPTQRA